MAPLDETLEVPALAHLERLDCSTSYCAANARGTGRFVRSSRLGDRWYLELHCPDCGCTMHVSSEVTEALVRALLAAPPGSRDAIAAAWVRARTNTRRPWTVP